MKIPSANLGRTCCVQKLFLAFRTFFVHNLTCSPPCSAKRRASDKDLPVQGQRSDFHFVKELILRNCKTLQTIDLAYFEWLKDVSKVDFFGRCLELTEFKITGGTKFEMRSDQLDLMIDSFPPNLLKIELSDFKNLSDLHIEKLVRKCNKITEISLCYTKITNQSVTTVVKHLKNSLQVLDLQNCKNVNLDNVFEAVRNLTQLNILYYDVHTGQEERCTKYAKKIQ